MIYIALIHSQPVYRKGLSLLLEQGVEGVEVIASVGNLRDLLEQFRETSLDVIVWDIPSHHALTPGARILRECYPLAKLLVLVSSSNSVYAGLLETLGANAVLPADCQVNELFQTILEIHERYAPHPSSNHVQEPLPLARDLRPRLCLKESTVLKLISDGLTGKEIARRLGLSESNISKCRSILCKKLKAETTRALIQKGIEFQFIESKNNQK